MSQLANIKVQNLNHLGIIDEIGDDRPVHKAIAKII